MHRFLGRLTGSGDTSYRGRRGRCLDARDALLQRNQARLDGRHMRGRASLLLERAREHLEALHERRRQERAERKAAKQDDDDDDYDVEVVYTNE